MSDMKALNLNDTERKQPTRSLSSPDRNNAETWENWEHLKLSAYHGRKLTKRNFKPYHPRVAEKTFFLHELDNHGFEPQEKWFIIMRTFKKLFGNIANSDTSKGRKFNTKLSFLRERGKQHLFAGKPITKLIAFPDSYWEAHKQILEGKVKSSEKGEGISTDPGPSIKRKRLETIPEETNTANGVRLRKRTSNK